MQISKRAMTIQESPIRKLAPLMVLARQRGLAIHHLNIGQPDIATPSAYLDAVAAYRRPGAVLSYGPSDGLPELRQAIADYFGRYGISLGAGDVLVTTGGSEAAFFALNLVADHGDEIIIPEPFYTN